MIIDAHAHVHPKHHGWGEKHDARLENLIGCIEKWRIDRAVLLPVASIVSNEFIGRCVEQYPDKLIGFVSVNPLEGNAAIEKMEEDVYRYKLKGLKLHPRLQNFRADDPRLIPLVQKAASMGLPVVIDTLIHGPSLLKDCMPLLVDEIARKVPAAKIVMAHMGGYKFMDALFVAKVNKNVYLDLSVTLLYFAGSPFQEQIGFVIHQVGAERCIYGSDHPTYTVENVFKSSVDVLNGYHLSSKEMDQILGGTISSLLNLQ